LRILGKQQFRDVQALERRIFLGDRHLAQGELARCEVEPGEAGAVAARD
jgi:hypothetical protein